MIRPQVNPGIFATALRGRAVKGAGRGPATPRTAVTCGSVRRGRRTHRSGRARCCASPGLPTWSALLGVVRPRPTADGPLRALALITYGSGSYAALAGHRRGPGAATSPAPAGHVRTRSQELGQQSGAAQQRFDHLVRDAYLFPSRLPAAVPYASHRHSASAPASTSSMPVGRTAQGEPDVHRHPPRRRRVGRRHPREGQRAHLVHRLPTRSVSPRPVPTLWPIERRRRGDFPAASALP